MDALINLAKKASKLDIHQLINQVLADFDIQKYIIELNQDNQLLEGKNSLGNVFGTYKNTYISKGGEYKVAGEPINLYDTGDFFESFQIRLGEKEFYIDANYYKGNYSLVYEYGEEIIGLTQESKEKLSEILYERIVLEIKAYLQNT